MIRNKANIANKLVTLFLISIFVEFLGILVTFGGILLEIALKAEIGFLAITMGSLIIAIGSGIFIKCGEIIKISRSMKR